MSRSDDRRDSVTGVPVFFALLLLVGGVLSFMYLRSQRAHEQAEAARMQAEAMKSRAEQALRDQLRKEQLEREHGPPESGAEGR